MIASVVMLLLLLSGLTATSSISNSIRGQYHNKLARQAANAGVRMAVACIRNKTVHETGLMKPHSVSCTNTTTTTSKPAYLVSTPNMKSHFEVEPPVSEHYPDARYYKIEATGYLDLYRTGSNQKWKTLKEKVTLRIQYQSQFATKSASGSWYVCGIINNKTFCWGRNTQGQLGNGEVASSSENYAQDAEGNPIVVQVVRNAPGTPYHDSRSSLGGSLSKDIDLATGNGSTCVISTNNNDSGALGSYNSARRVACWGESSYGELGRGVVTTTPTPYPRLTYQTWANQSPAQYPRQIVSGGHYVCLITNRTSGDSSGNTWCWGGNTRGQLGRGSTSDYGASPRRVRDMNGQSGTGIVLFDIAATPDSSHLCGRRSASRVVCWGFNRWGQVGDGTDGRDGGNNSSSTTQRFKTHPHQVITTDNEALRAQAPSGSIAVGGTFNRDAAHSCAIGRAHTGSPKVLDGRIYCWGTNNYGQLGRGGPNTNIYRRANLVTSGFGGTNYRASIVALSNVSTCAVVKVPASASQSSVYCWGHNGYGEVGVNTTTEIYGSPRKVSFFDGMDVTALNGGAYRFCAVANQSNYCWGRDHVGQVGDGVVNSVERQPSLSKFLEPDYNGLLY